MRPIITENVSKKLDFFKHTKHSSMAIDIRFNLSDLDSLFLNFAQNLSPKQRLLTKENKSNLNENC